MRVDWSDFAKADLENLISYISIDSVFYARMFGERIVLATRQLSQKPGHPLKPKTWKAKNLDTH